MKQRRMWRTSQGRRKELLSIISPMISSKLEKKPRKNMKRTTLRGTYGFPALKSMRLSVTYPPFMRINNVTHAIAAIIGQNDERNPILLRGLDKQGFTFM